MHLPDQGYYDTKGTLMRKLFPALLVGLFATFLTSGLYADQKQKSDSAINREIGSETAQSALTQVQGNVNKIQTLIADIEMDRERKEKKKKTKKDDPNKTPGPFAGWEPEGRYIKRGPLVISRNTGAHLILKRKNSTDEYIANKSTLWSYDHGDKEARYIPTSLPVLKGLISAAYSLDVFSALDSSTLKLIGTQDIDGVPCWVIQGKSPSTLSMVGIEAVTLRVWVSKTDGIPRQIKIPSNEDMIIRVRNIKLNEPVDPSKFNWSLPSGVKGKNIFGF